jgi:hypothetical protein
MRSAVILILIVMIVSPVAVSGGIKAWLVRQAIKSVGHRVTG